MFVGALRKAMDSDQIDRYGQCYGSWADVELRHLRILAAIAARPRVQLRQHGRERHARHGPATPGRPPRPRELPVRPTQPLYMMQGLDDSFDAAFFVSYHGSADYTSSVLHHTYNPRPSPKSA